MSRPTSRARHLALLLPQSTLVRPRCSRLTLGLLAARLASSLLPLSSSKLFDGAKPRKHIAASSLPPSSSSGPSGSAVAGVAAAAARATLAASRRLAANPMTPTPMTPAPVDPRPPVVRQDRPARHQTRRQYSLQPTELWHSPSSLTASWTMRPANSRLFWPANA